MIASKTNRGFVVVEHPRYVEPHDPVRIVQESSAVGDYPDSLSKPGSSYLWIGEHHHLNREEVAELVKRMQYWLKHKRLQVAKKVTNG